MNSPEEIQNLYSDMLAAADKGFTPEFTYQWPSPSQLFGIALIVLIETAGVFAIITHH